MLLHLRSQQHNWIIDENHFHRSLQERSPRRVAAWHNRHPERNCVQHLVERIVPSW